MALLEKGWTAEEFADLISSAVGDVARTVVTERVPCAHVLQLLDMVGKEVDMDGRLLGL
ncbi:hypothetical protein [Nocardia africana]|uniref:Uncharacterized protein n=1 Tax=Nocardia africana TaxID=134964 RepID=A0ABW6NE29_9NOCA